MARKLASDRALAVAEISRLALENRAVRVEAYTLLHWAVALGGIVVKPCRPEPLRPKKTATTCATCGQPLERNGRRWQHTLTSLFSDHEPQLAFSRAKEKRTP